MKIELSLSGSYLPDGIDPLMEELNGDGVEVVLGGHFQRRAAGDLLPILIMAVAFAAGAVRTGFLNAMGADAWATLMRVVARTSGTRRYGTPPSIGLDQV